MSDRENGEENIPAKRKLLSYTIDYKLEAVSYLKSHSVTETAKRYKVDRRRISVLSTGHDKLNITVMLTGRSDGFKCRPFVLLPRKRIDQKIVAKFGTKLHLSWKGRSWMDDELTENYLMTVFGSGAFQRRLLVWDAFRCHISAQTKKILRKIQLHTIIVPSGCTKFVQVKYKFNYKY